jgi:hypothetical protein
VKIQSSWKPETRNKATAPRGGIRGWFPWRNMTWTGDKVGYEPRIDRSQAVLEQLPKLWFPCSNGLIRTTETSRRFNKRCSLNPGILSPLHIFTYTRPRWNAAPSNAWIRKNACTSFSCGVFRRTDYIKNSTTVLHGCYCCYYYYYWGWDG